MTKIPRFQDYNYDANNPTATIDVASVEALSPEVAIQLYTEMVRLRVMEEELIKEYHPADEMRCPVHFCVGQEAAPAAVSLLITPEDFVFSHHRSHGWYLAKVHTMGELFAEMYGRENGADGGKAGSQDISNASANFFSGAILAGTYPIATGAAMGFKIKNLPYCAVAATGDGSTDEGVTWEAINYASLKKLPVIFICENNYYSTYSPQHHRQLTCNISERVQQFGVPTRTFFGNDVVRWYLELKNAITFVREGQGPMFLEAFTYRWNAHVGPEDDDYIGYRSEDEREYWKRHDPIVLQETQMLALGMLTKEMKENIYTRAYLEVAEAFDFAKHGRFSTEPSWEKFNYSGLSPVADALLISETSLDFDQYQPEALPGPY
jgi:TPP-dependent pyruvate/acetoin dehydrogenase alpha subunit